MNRYVAFYGGKRIEVRAPSSYAAQLEAAKQFGVRFGKAYQVSVVLAEMDGEQVAHDPAAVIS